MGEITDKHRLERWLSANPVKVETTPLNIPGGNHWEVTLSRIDDSGNILILTPTNFRLFGYQTPPDAQLVLNALLDDASTIENARSIEEWADELGFTWDEEEEWHTLVERYEKVNAQTEELKVFVGDQYKWLLWG